MIIAVVILALAVTVNFMSYVTIRKKIETAKLEVVNLIEISSNKIVKEVQEGNHFGEKAIGLVSCNINQVGDTLKATVLESSDQINGVIMRESAKNIYLHIRGAK